MTFKVFHKNDLSVGWESTEFDDYEQAQQYGLQLLCLGETVYIKWIGA